MAAQGSVWLCGSGRWGGVKVYTVTSQKLPPSASIRREREVVPLSKKAAVMTSEPCPPSPHFYNLESHPSPQPFLHLLIHCCYDNSDLSPPCPGSYICYQLNGQKLFPQPQSYIHTHTLKKVVCKMTTETNNWNETPHSCLRDI